MAVAASQTTSIGTHHKAARYSRPGGQPASQAAAAPPPATSATGAATPIRAAAARTPAVLNAARAAAGPADLLPGRPITAGTAPRRAHPPAQPARARPA